MRMLLNDMKRALDRGVKIRILTGNYLGITQPSALYLIKSELGDRVDLRLYNETSRSFHPKSYIFHYESSNEIYIGSSNISKSALTSGIEWNYRFSDTLDKKNYELFYATFEDLFLNHSIIIDDEELKRYSKAWKKPAVSKDLAKYDATEDGEDRNAENVRMLYRPRGAQIEALYALQESRMEGAAKGLVYAATGIGKTYLAAFDSAKYKRVLFVAHREEILKQAVVSFKNVRNSADYGFFDGKEKDRDKSVIFASVATLGRTEYLNETYFPADYFEYVIIDEFHHAVTDQYRRIVEYFQPQFLLGLTATPERMDGKNIYEICDYNVPYQISLKEAINKGMLVPFHYYGVYDETDYSGLRIVKGRYDEQELNQAYIGNERRYDLIYKYYRKYRSLRAIGFCCSRQHAEDMAKEFCQRGIASAAVYSGENGAYAEERNEAIRKLKNGEIRVIFSVDMFNEGMDIASLDMVMFLRPTESPVVFLQQLGRGLRLYKGKEYLNVLDFIGNYEKAGKAPLLLSGEQSFNKKGSCEYQDLEYPDDCIVDFDMRLIDLFKEIDKKKLTLKMQIQKEYYRVKGLLDGKRPSRMDLFTYMDDDIYRCCVSGSHAKGNPFQHYLDFLYELGELSADEQELYAGIGREFIQTIETTEMQKVYTMPILYSFYNQGNIRLKLRECMARIEPTEGKVIYKQLDRIQQLIEKMEPTDIRVKHRECYLGNRCLFDKGNYANRWKMLEDKKLSVVKEIFDEYGSEEVERFGCAVKNVHDVANKLGRFLRPNEMSSIIEKYFIGILSKEFTINCLISFVYTQGAEKLLETSLCQMEDEFMLEILSKIPFSLQLLDVINQVLDDDTAYWEKGAMPYSCYDAEELKIIVEKLVACKRYVTAVNIIGHSECEAVINAECIYKLMKLAGTEESIGVETLDDYAVQKIIGWFQQQEDIDLELRSDIEFIYLPMLDEYSEVRPRALNTRLSLEPEYFCSLIELFYKERNGEKREIELNKSLSDRLYEILFQFKVIPGIDWNGNFDAKRFDYWMKTVKTWSRDNDRYEVAMHTVGSGLSYAELDEDKLPQTAIIEELNRVENEELRRGYYLGIINQRGVHWIDPEGKPELELAEDYENKANIAESRGYSRYAGILRGVADEFKREAKSNILEAKNGDDE